MKCYGAGGSLVGWENEGAEECSINAMAPLFEVYREAERADIKKEKYKGLSTQ